MWSSEIKSGSLAANSALPASIAQLVASARPAAFIIRAEIGEHIGEATEVSERAIRLTDGWLVSLAAVSETQAWFFRHLAFQTSGFVKMACARTDRDPLKEASSWKEDDHSLKIDPDAAAKVEWLRAKAMQFGFQFVNLETVEIPHSVIELVEESVARENVCLPIAFQNGKLALAVVDPMNFELIEKLRFVLNRDIEMVMAQKEQILAGLNRYYGQAEGESVAPANAKFSPETRRRNMLQRLGLFWGAVRGMAGEIKSEADDVNECDWAMITFTWID